MGFLQAPIKDMEICTERPRKLERIRIKMCMRVSVCVRVCTVVEY